MQVTKEFSFEASHILPKHKGKCSQLHGHSWRLWVTVEGPINPDSGFVVDFYDVSTVVNRHIVQTLDHSHLGYGVMVTQDGQHFMPPWGHTFYPSSENLVTAIAKVLQPYINELGKDIYLSEVRLSETCTSAATWRPSVGTTAR